MISDEVFLSIGSSNSKETYTLGEKSAFVCNVPNQPPVESPLTTLRADVFPPTDPHSTGKTLQLQYIEEGL